MKLKLFLVITNPDAYLRGDYASCFSLYDYDPCVNDWYTVGEVEFTFVTNNLDLSQRVLDAIERELDSTRETFTKRMEVLEGRKAQLLAITHVESPEPPEPPEPMA